MRIDGNFIGEIRKKNQPPVKIHFGGPRPSQAHGTEPAPGQTGKRKTLTAFSFGGMSMDDITLCEGPG